MDECCTVMGAPLITDWVQTAIAGAGFLMAAGSLLWQWRTSHISSKPDMAAEALEQADGVWHVWLYLSQAPRSTGLTVKVDLLTRDGTVFDVEALPLSKRYDPMIFLIPRPDFGQAHRQPSVRSLEVKVSHDEPHAPGASVQFGLRLPSGSSSARIRATLRGVGLRRSLRTKTMVISPIA